MGDNIMSKIIENFLIPLFVVISILYAFNSFSRDSIELSKAYHHITREPGYLERANISFYFSRDPQVQEIKKEKSNAAITAFFFPEASIAHGECEAMIQNINAQHSGYNVSIKQVTMPARGIEIVFNIDPEQCVLCYESFDSIGLQKGLVFRLYNKDILKSIENNNNKMILRTLHNQHKPRIVIDPGHGGRDSGAVGRNGIYEKEVCLAIGTAVGNLLEQQGCSVLLTRKSDRDMDLDERTAYANNNHADLFVSIHANHAASERAVGVETFCMQSQLFKKMYSNLSPNQDACVVQCMNERFRCSYELAQSVQKYTCAAAAPFRDESIDRKVKHSVSQVLMGTQAPAILIEVGFLSHPKESRLLNDVQYQQSIARGISNGIASVLNF